MVNTSIAGSRLARRQKATLAERKARQSREVAAPLATVDVPVDLPATTAQRQQRPDKPVFLTIKADRSLAIGEVFNTVWDYQTLIREQLIDYVRSAVTHTGGISPMKKLSS